MGFDTINKLAEKYNIEVTRKGFEGLYGIGEVESKKVILLKPQTYMNESGKSIIKAKDFYKIDIQDIIVIYDDIDLDVGTVKLRKKGGAGTHNGMKSVIEYLEDDNFVHIKIGTGKPEFKELLIPYVIEKMTDTEYENLKLSIEKAADSVKEIFENGIDVAMNKYN